MEGTEKMMKLVMEDMICLERVEWGGGVRATDARVSIRAAAHLPYGGVIGRACQTTSTGACWWGCSCCPEPGAQVSDWQVLLVMAKWPRDQVEVTKQNAPSFFPPLQPLTGKSPLAGFITCAKSEASIETPFISPSPESD